MWESNTSSYEFEKVPNVSLVRVKERHSSWYGIQNVVVECACAFYGLVATNTTRYIEKSSAFAQWN